jgi:non-specific serine/threonine protein kinase
VRNRVAGALHTLFVPPPSALTLFAHLPKIRAIMAERAHHIAFGRFHLDLTEPSLWAAGTRLSTTPKQLAILVHLVRNAGRLVSKDELLTCIWPDCHVVESVVKTHIAQIRQVLGDTAEKPQFIETVGRQGYRFVALVEASNLPRSLASFIGREREAADLQELLKTHRLVTVTGPPGVGKTCLARHVAAAHLRDMRPWGVWWVDLSTVSESGLVADAVMAALGVTASGGCSVAGNLVKTIGEKPVLLVLDNCEHLVDGCAALTHTLLMECPNLRILTGSRERLRIAGETVSPLTPLSVPPGSVARWVDLMGCDSVRLFVERAKRVNSLVVLSDENVAAIGRICRSLDGLPLAIELAAMRARVLTLQQISSRLEDGIGLLGQGGRTEPRRHHTLTAAFDWSYLRLSSEQRRLLTYLSVFSGSFTLDAVESACGAQGFDTRLINLIDQLVERSLVTVTEAVQEGMRYRLLNTVRRYALERLPPDTRETLARRHADYFTRVAEEKDDVAIAASSEHQVRLHRERDNFRAALEWACRNDGDMALRIANALLPYWSRRAEYSEARVWFTRALKQGAHVSPHRRALGLYGAGNMASTLGQADIARVELETSIDILRTTDDVRNLGRALLALGHVMEGLGHFDAAQQLEEEGIGHLRQTGKPWDLAVGSLVLGRILRAQGDEDAALPHFEQAAAMFRDIPDAWMLVWVLGELACLTTSRREYALAEQYWHESLVVAAPLVESWNVSLGIAGIADAAFRRGDYRNAVRLMGAAETIRQAADLRPADFRRTELCRRAHVLQVTLGDATFRRLWAEGGRLSRDEAIALALRLTSPAPELKTA